MATQGTLTLNTKAYTPAGKSGDVASWRLAGDATFGGAFSSVGESLRGPSRDGMYNVRFTLKVPKAASADSACACTGQTIGDGIADIQVKIPATFTAAERLDFCLRIQGLVANAVFTAAVSGLEGAW